MTVFYFEGSDRCRVVKGAFDFFDGTRVESIERSVSSMDVSYSDEQIGFIVPFRNQSFPAEVVELISKSTLSAKYFFALIVCSENSSGSAGKFMSLCSGSGISLSYVDTVPPGEGGEALSEKAIAFRNDAGLFVSRIHGTSAMDRLLGMIESIKSKVAR